MAKIGKVSKNARKGVKTQSFTHTCGGNIIMRSVMTGGKLRHFAECNKCGEKARRPKEMTYI